ncbi:MAG: 5-(carboxyamino)imidazole ribonucleotide synthase [Hyphomicrobiales bacterium]
MATLPPGATIGILGGGQLGRMMAIAAARYGLQVHIFTPESNAPAADVSKDSTRADYEDTQALLRFAAACDVVTYEFENIPRASLEALAGAVPLRPGIASLETSQDRLVEKQFLENLGLHVAPYRAINSAADIVQAHQELGKDTILKTCRFGYDGKGQARLKPDTDIDQQKLWQSVGAQPSVLEARIPFIAELSAVISRGQHGQCVAYDVPVNTHKDGILDTSAIGSFASTSISETLAQQAQDAAMRVANALDHVGVLTVEFFLTDSNELLVNEFAPRVHNSGHWTMDACLNDQFDNHIRAVAGMPLGSAARHSDALMTNLIADDVEMAHDWSEKKDVQLHLYAKGEARKGRKMGHVTQIAPIRTQSHQKLSAKT